MDAWRYIHCQPGSQQLFGLRHSDEYVYEFWASMYEEQITPKVVVIFFIF